MARKNALARVGTGDVSGAIKAEYQKNCDGLTWMLQRWLDFPSTRCIFDFASLSYPFFTRSACRDDCDGPLRVNLGARSTLLLSVSMLRARINETCFVAYSLSYSCAKYKNVVANCSRREMLLSLMLHKSAFFNTFLYCNRITLKCIKCKKGCNEVDAKESKCISFHCRVTSFAKDKEDN